VSKITNYQLKFVKYGSSEYQQAARLRYRLFYQEHGIRFESIFDPQERQSLHLVITNTDRILAYGRLERKSVDEFQIYELARSLADETSAGSLVRWLSNQNTKDKD
jgi:hypothetical protein